ncbi:hypothetical protein DPMN_164458 [Dreissena polymorpha]|uniref:Uncharacterized protein n=1 Tax=Dreissena polymorpha TaxID=45954 RepID=A0A9D4ISD1_DREPO|nr:hypothetical protein DPMN_164458 [Dreissena polymorpha]
MDHHSTRSLVLMLVARKRSSRYWKKPKRGAVHKRCHCVNMLKQYGMEEYGNEEEI